MFAKALEESKTGESACFYTSTNHDSPKPIEINRMVPAPPKP